MSRSDYALLQGGCVRRSADGVAIPSDPDNTDWREFEAWRAAGNAPDPVPPEPFDADAVARECQRRIYAVASQNCQMNMTAWIASGRASDADRAAFDAALAWVQAMRAAHAQLVAAKDAGYAQDAWWPVCPADAAAIAARF